MTLAPVTTNTGVTWQQPNDTSWVALMRPAADLAVQIADTEFVPSDLRNRPGAIAACILYGSELGLGPMQSLAKIDIVKGRPAPRAELGRALALAAGHELWVEEQTNTRVVMKGHRRNSSHVFTVTWSMDDARKAGIAGNPAYAKYPRQMLLARASAELVRQMCPDVTGGIVMFAEEAADADPADLTPTMPPVAAVKPPATSKRSRAAKTPAPTETPTDEPVEDKPTEAQTKMAMAAFADVGIHERDDRIAATSALIDRKVDSWNDLNRNEASTVIDGLERVKAGGISWHITDDHVWRILHNTDDELLDETEPT
jgi:hypothetical protein